MEVATDNVAVVLRLPVIVNLAKLENNFMIFHKSLQMLKTNVHIHKQREIYKKYDYGGKSAYDGQTNWKILSCRLICDHYSRLLGYLSCKVRAK